MVRCVEEIVKTFIYLKSNPTSSMMIQGGDSILARQSRTELLDVLLSNSLELYKNLEKLPDTNMESL